MSYFGPARGKPSFFNDPTFAGQDVSGLDPTGLQNAIDANVAGATQGRRGFGDSTLSKIIGILGDGALGFVGQPAAYGASIREERERQQKMMEEDERRRREMQWQWDNEPEDWYIRRAMEQWYEPDVQAATPPYARARSAMAATQNGDRTRGEVWNEFGMPRGLFGRAGW
jgi:hypothetical protein